MVESDIFPVLPFVVDVEQDVLVLDHCQIGEVDAGKGIVALGALLLSAGAGDDLSVKDDIYAVGPFTGGEPQAVQQVGAGVGHIQVDGLLCAGDDDGLFGVLDQVGHGGSSIGHGIGAVADHKAVVVIVIFLQHMA